MVCINCDYKENAPNSICSIQNASDGLPIRCVGLWAKEKYFYLNRYFDIFTTAMKNIWRGELYYIDLFAGCGKCRVRETGEEIDGSALLAISIKYPFKKYFMVDLDKNAISALTKRVKSTPYNDRVVLIQGDCNEKIDEILAKIPEKSLSVAVIDPTGLHIMYDTLQKLTADRKVDLVITFPEGMDIKRNLSKYIRKSPSILDDYFGDKEWRRLFPKNINQLTDIKIEKSLINYYRKILNKLGYVEVKAGYEILIRSSQKNLPLYYLLFASKHSLGHKFWQKISAISSTGQMKLPMVREKTVTYKTIKPIYITVRRPQVINNDYKLINGKTKQLVARVNDGSIVVRFDKTPPPKRLIDVVCPHFVELKWAYGCPYDCSWCYLKGTFRFHPNGKAPVVKDYDKIELHTRTFLEEVETPEILNTGEIADSLMFEYSDNPFSKFIIPMFESQNKHKVLFLTKSSDIKNLLEMPSHNQVIMSFSLNAIPVAERWEKAPRVLKRLDAAQKLSDVGFEVRVRVDPMVPIENWEKYYLELIDLIFEKFVPERITLGSLRGLQSTINGSTDKSWVQYLTETSNWGKKIDTKIRYQMYSSIISYLNTNYNYKNIGLCKETVKMWKMLDMDYKRIKCNCIW